jgi:hypothetical protein
MKSGVGAIAGQADAGEAAGPMIELVIAVSCFVIGFCATDFVCYRIRTGSWF